MTIEKVWFHDLEKSPRELSGTIMVIDAQAATANMAILLSKNPSRIIVVNEKNLGLARTVHPSGILIGESNTLPTNAFAWDNHQDSMYKSNVKGKTLLYMSINGTKLVDFALARLKQGEVITGSLLNAQAIANYGKEKGLPITMLMSGDQGEEVAEDKICADVIEHQIHGTIFDWNALKKEIVMFFKNHYRREVDVDIPYLTDHLNSLAIVPRCMVNEEGFIEVRAMV